MGEEKAGEDLKRHGRDEGYRIAVVGIIIESLDLAGAVNEVLHQYSDYIIGRMGLPYREKQVNIISVVLDAPSDVISAVSGKLGRLPGSALKRCTHGRKGNTALMPEKSIQSPAPNRVGRRIETAVHFQDPVSFLILKIVVRQGQ